MDVPVPVWNPVEVDLGSGTSKPSARLSPKQQERLRWLGIKRKIEASGDDKAGIVSGGIFGVSSLSLSLSLSLSPPLIWTVRIWTVSH
jgi:hypothetical protein